MAIDGVMFAQREIGQAIVLANQAGDGLNTLLRRDIFALLPA